MCHNPSLKKDLRRITKCIHCVANMTVEESGVHFLSLSGRMLGDIGVKRTQKVTDMQAKEGKMYN